MTLFDTLLPQKPPPIPKYARVVTHDDETGKRKTEPVSLVKRGMTGRKAYHHIRYKIIMDFLKAQKDRLTVLQIIEGIAVIPVGTMKTDLAALRMAGQIESMWMEGNENTSGQRYRVYWV